MSIDIQLFRGATSKMPGRNKKETKRRAIRCEFEPVGPTRTLLVQGGVYCLPYGGWALWFPTYLAIT